MKDNVLRIAVVFDLVLIIWFFGFYGSYIENKNKEPMVTAFMLHSVSNASVNENLGRVVISKENLIKDIEYLQAQGFSFVGQDDVRNILKNNNAFGSKNIWLTFDDGYKDNYTVLYPILKEKNIKALINLIVNYVENGNPDYLEGYLNWEQVNEMKDSGLVDFGSHSFDSHKYVQAVRGKDRPALATQTIIDGKPETNSEYIERIKADLTESWALMNLRMGIAPKIIAYPYGKTNNVVDEIVEYTGFDIKIGIKKGINRKEEDLANIKRINISDKYTPYEIEELINYYKGISIIF